MAALFQSARTCVGCRQEDSRDALLRFVLAGDPPALVPDVTRRASGRGVSVHPRRLCIDAAVRTGALRRGLRAPQASPTSLELMRWATGQYWRRIDGLLIAAYRSGSAALGTDAVNTAVSNQRVLVLVVADDAVDKRRDLLLSAERIGASRIAYRDKVSLGKLFGRDTLAVVAVTDPDLAAELRRAADGVAALAEAS